MALIHPGAMIDPGAEIAENCEIGPFCTVGPNVVLRSGVKLISHVIVTGHTEIGTGTTVHPFSSIGSIPQDLKYRGEPGRLEIGERNVIREHVTVNIGTEGGGMLTKIGDDNLLMVGVHVGHDCRIGDRVILVNNATLAGHVDVDDRAVLGGLCAVHQFCRIGRFSMIGGMTGVEHDVMPYATVTGNRAILRGLNLIGLERAGHDKTLINQMRGAYKILFDKQRGTFENRLDEISGLYPENMLVSDVVAFFKVPSKRRFVMPEID